MNLPHAAIWISGDAQGVSQRCLATLDNPRVELDFISFPPCGNHCRSHSFFPWIVDTPQGTYWLLFIFGWSSHFSAKHRLACIPSPPLAEPVSSIRLWTPFERRSSSKIKGGAQKLIFSITTDLYFAVYTEVFLRHNRWMDTDKLTQSNGVS